MTIVVNIEKRIRAKEKLTHSCQKTPKRVLLQTVKSQMKCSMMLHFIRGYTVCKGKKDFQKKGNDIFF